jgi:hypothetical protein
MKADLLVIANGKCDTRHTSLQKYAKEKDMDYKEI